MNSSKKLIPISDHSVGLLSIGRISKATGVKDVTLRYYESEGLLPRPSARKKSGHRRYGENVIPHIQLIRAARGAGMTVPEIKALLCLLRGFKPPALALMREVRENIVRLDCRINHLQEISRLLKNVLECPQRPVHQL